MRGNGRSGPMRKARLGIIAAAAGAAAVLAGCYPGEITSVEQTDVVITLHDRDFDFSQNRTYAMPDTVLDICRDLEDVECDNPVEIDHSFDSEILARVDANMASLDYEKISLEDLEVNPADVVMLVAVMANEREAYVYYPWYGYWGYWPGWGAYPPGWGPGWGGGYPCCGGVGTVTYQAGTLFLNMVDPDLVDPEAREIPAIWAGALNAVLSKSEGNNRGRALDGIDQMFAQSQYLKVGGQ